ncbi:unnamed protein product, partial [Urochloa humidicola]
VISRAGVISTPPVNPQAVGSAQFAILVVRSDSSRASRPLTGKPENYRIANPREPASPPAPSLAGGRPFLCAAAPAAASTPPSSLARPLPFTVRLPRHPSSSSARCQLPPPLHIHIPISTSCLGDDRAQGGAQIRQGHAAPLVPSSDDDGRRQLRRLPSGSLWAHLVSPGSGTELACAAQCRRNRHAQFC